MIKHEVPLFYFTEPSDTAMAELEVIACSTRETCPRRDHLSMAHRDDAGSCLIRAVNDGCGWTWSVGKEVTDRILFKLRWFWQDIGSPEGRSTVSSIWTNFCRRVLRGWGSIYARSYLPGCIICFQYHYTIHSMWAYKSSSQVVVVALGRIQIGGIRK